ncbi:MAG TPA: hypothetical protein VHX38_12270 [Pseudonocardiaceae bacterium]|jgi:hypothetical protein|nr:hypothetical protein [Pseudonocardiaceae bacterium]
MTDDRVTRWSSPASPGNQAGATDPDQGRLPGNRPPVGSGPARPAAIPVRRAAVNPARSPEPDPMDAHTTELPVMTDEEFEAAQAAAQRAKEERAAAALAAEQAAEDAAAAEAVRAPRRRSLLAGCTGALTAATVLIALIAILAQVLSSNHGEPGPGLVDVAGQTVIAVLVVLLQRVVDHRTGARRGWAAFGVLVATLASFGVFWWAWLWLFWSV